MIGGGISAHGSTVVVVPGYHLGEQEQLDRDVHLGVLFAIGPGGADGISCCYATGRKAKVMTSSPSSASSTPPSWGWGVRFEG